MKMKVVGAKVPYVTMNMEAMEEFLVKEESATELLPVGHGNFEQPLKAMGFMVKEEPVSDFEHVKIDEPFVKDEPDWTTVKEEMKDDFTIVESFLELEEIPNVTPTSSAEEDDVDQAGCGLGVSGHSSEHLSTDDHQVQKSRKHHVVPSLIILFDANGVSCEDCSMCFSTVNDLKTHLKVHSNREEYKCDHCGKCFFTGQCIKGHMPISSYLTYKCKECGECVTGARNMKSHLRIHDNIKQYKCEQCGKCFKQNKGLKLHATTHSGMKDYECDQCGKCFTTRNSLRIHLNSNCGVKIYTCDQCGKCFATGGGLASHLKMHTSSIKYFKCPVGPMW